jgi:GNAT superfamily N-acetyltransferase
MPDITVRPLDEHDVPDASRIARLAFGTFLGRADPDPDPSAPEGDHLRTLWLADPTAAFAAELDGRLVGSNFATHWGHVGFFGPLTVHPDHWNQGIGKRLLEPVVAAFATWGVTHAGLFTFAHSTKHVHLYQAFGFWPRFLTAIMTKPVGERGSLPGWSRFSALPKDEQATCLAACRALSDALYAGLDVERDIRAVQTQQVGDTVLLWDDSRLVGFAVCYYARAQRLLVTTEADRGRGSGSGTCYVKFGAVRPGPTAQQEFERLLQTCETLAASEGLASVEAGVNLGRHEAYRAMLAAGFQTGFQGVAMHQPNEPGYSRPDVYVIDDWR